MKKNGIKITLDVIMTVILIALMNLSATGLYWHEVLGLFVFGLFFIHNVLNLQWIKGVALSIFSEKVKPRIKFMFVLNSVLLVFMSITVISGILISQIILTSITTNNTAFWSAIHTSFSYSSFILVSVHLGLHWKSIMGAFRKMFSLRTENKARKIILRSVAVVLIIIGIKNSFSNSVGQKILMPVTGINNEHTITTQITTQTTEMYDSEKLSSNINLVSTSTTATDSGTSLEDYLGKLVCTACPKRCPLLSPQCGKGVAQAQQAETKYNSLVKQSQSSTTAQSSSTSNDLVTSAAQDIESDNLLDAFADFLPILTLYVAGTYYTVKFVGKVN